MTRILFLDIDGVLNDHQPGPSGYCGILFEKVILLNKIVRMAKCDIVLSSAWRYMILSGECTVLGFQSWLRVFGFTGYVVGHTASDEDIDTRGQQIADWVKVNVVTSYVVVDDLDDDIAEIHGDRFIKTNSKVGLTNEIVEEIIARFKKDRE